MQSFVSHLGTYLLFALLRVVRWAGRTQVGAFPHYGRWSEWNGHFRDTVRQFVKGTDGPWASNFASVLCGSPHIYLHEPGAEDW